jgi:SAM-dependent methyltransferase
MSEQKIPYQEVKFHPHSFGDYHIRLFQWNEQLYRGICTEGAPFFTKLFEDGVIQNLTERGLLIESECDTLTLDGYELVVRHRRLPFASYPNEWCAAMFKDGVLTLVDLAIALAKQGLTLGDAHPWNLLFDMDKGKPVFVDLGSIDFINDSTWRVYDEFCRFCLYPLLLMSSGQTRIARLLMCEHEGVLKSDLLRLTSGNALSGTIPNRSLFSRLESALRQQLPASSLQQFKKILSEVGLFKSRKQTAHANVLGNMREKSHLKFLENVRREVEIISFPSPKAKREAESELSLSLFIQDYWTTKQKIIHKILSQLQPATVLDIGSGSGWYSKLAASLGSKVVSFDIDETCITQLYVEARAEQLPILPLVMDFTKPTPSRGLANHWAIAATERFPCEMVLALAVVDHLVLKQRLNFDQIVEGLAQFSERWVVVEFIPREDPAISKLWSERVSWYTLDHFMDALRKRFGKVRVMPSGPESRVLLLCEKEQEKEKGY